MDNRGAASSSHKEFLRISTELQSDLIKKLYDRCDLADLLGQISARVTPNSLILVADACAVYIVDDARGSNGQRTAYMRAASGYQQKYIGIAAAKVLDPAIVPEEPTEEEKLGVTGWVISTGRAFLARTAKELTDHPHHAGVYDSVQLPSAERVTTFLAVPLRNLTGQIIGALKAERLGREQPFSVEDQLVLETLARVAGRCIIYEQEAREDSLDTAITLWAREAIAEAVASEGELDSFLDMATKIIAAATRADSCSIFHIDQARRTLTQRAGSGDQALRKVVRSYMMPDKDEIVDCINTKVCDPDTCEHRAHESGRSKVGLTAWIAATGKSFHAKDQVALQKHCHWRGQFDVINYTEQQACGALLGVPLQVGGSTIGVLKVENVAVKNEEVGRDFTEDDRRRLDLLAQEVAISVERLQLQYRTRYQVIEEAMPTILEILRGELAVEKLMIRVVEATAKLFQARSCSLFLKEGNELIQRAGVGYATFGPPRRYELVPRNQIKPDPEPKEKVGLTVWIAVMEQMFTAKSNLELTAHPHHRGTYDRYNFREEERCESFMGIPLMVAGQGGRTGQEMVGVLKVETKMRSVGGEQEFAYFNELDELAFTLMANSAAIAIQNARLLAARALAERILAMPDANEVIRELHEFQGGHADVINTLRATSDAVGEKDNYKAGIVSSFTGMLEPDYDSAIPLQLADRVRDPVREMLQALAVCLNARDLDQIRGLQEHVEWARVLRGDFFLATCAQGLVADVRQIGENLSRHDRNPRDRAALVESKEWLKDSLVQIEQMNPFERSVLGGICRRWLSIIEARLGDYQEVVNPYQAGNPLPPDSPLFVGREETFRWIEEMLCAEGQKNSLFLHAGWHTGKTSILRQIEAGPRGERLRTGRKWPVYPVFVDIQAISTHGTDALLLRIADFMAKGLERRGISITAPDLTEFRADSGRAFSKFLDAAIKQLGNGLLVVMVDEFEVLFERVEKGKLDVEIVTYLRSIMQHQPQVAFIFAARYSLDVLDTKDRTKLFNVAQHREIGFLNDEEADQLIRGPVRDQGVHYDDSVVRRIQRLTGGNPYFIQQLCHSCIEILNNKKSGYRVQEEHLNEALRQALQPGNVVTIEAYWGEVGPNSQRVLFELAQLSAEDSPWVAGSELYDATRQAGLNEDDISAGVTRLSAYRLIEQEKPDTSQEIMYRYSMDLMRLWVLRQPKSRRHGNV